MDSILKTVHVKRWYTPLKNCVLNCIFIVSMSVKNQENLSLKTLLNCVSNNIKPLLKNNYNWNISFQ